CGRSGVGSRTWQFSSTDTDTPTSVVLASRSADRTWSRRKGDSIGVLCLLPQLLRDWYRSVGYRSINGSRHQRVVCTADRLVLSRMVARLRDAWLSCRPWRARRCHGLAAVG